MHLYTFLPYDPAEISLETDQDRPRSYNAFTQLVSAWFYRQSTIGENADKGAVKALKKLKRKLLPLGIVVDAGTPAERRVLLPTGGRMFLEDGEHKQLKKMWSALRMALPAFLCDEIDDTDEFLAGETDGCGVRELSTDEFKQLTAES